MPNLGEKYMSELMNEYTNQQTNRNMITMRECWKYISGIFCYRAKGDYYSVALKDKNYKKLLAQGQDTSDCIPSEYYGCNNRNSFKVSAIEEKFRTWTYIDNINDQDKTTVVDTYSSFVDTAKKYLEGIPDVSIDFGNSSAEYIQYGWLFKKIEDDSINTAMQNGYQYMKGFMCIALAMLVGNTIDFKSLNADSTSRNADVDYDKLKNESREIAKDLVLKMGINNPPDIFFNSAKSFMYLLLTAYCFDDDMQEKEKQKLRETLIKESMGVDTDEYKYREKLLKDVAKKNELLAAADTIISDYYVLPTLSEKIKLNDDGRIRCKLEAKIGYGKTTFYRAIVTLMLRKYIIDKRITDEETKLDELEQTIKDSWADIEFSNFFPIYINSLTINRRTEVKDLMQLAEGSEYADLIRQYAGSDKGRRVMLIIDGLDEVNNYEQRQRLSELIDAFIDKYQNINYIVSTRPIDLAAYENEYDAGAFLNGIQKVTINELSPEQKKAIIDKWVRVLSDEVDVDKRLERIRATINESHYFSDLSGNPSLLAATVQQLTVDKPPKQKEIISNIVDYLIKKKMHSRLQVQLKITNNDIRRVLSCLAYNCITKNINAFDWANLSTLYINAYQSVSDKIELTQKDKKIWSDSLLEINTKVGLIVFDEETQNYHWQSETLELFLAAEWALLEFQYLVDNNGESGAGTQIREQLDMLRKYTRWEDIFIMMLVGWDEIYERSIFRSVIKIIIRYLLDLTITIDTKLIKSIGQIILICCLEEYAYSCDDIVYEDDKEKVSIKLMLRFINQNAQIIDVNGERLEECNNRAKYRVFYDGLCQQRLI